MHAYRRNPYKQAILAIYTNPNHHAFKLLPTKKLGKKYSEAIK